MVAFIDLAPVPTISLFLAVPVAIAEGGWKWGELPRYAGELAREYVYTAAECAALVASYGRAMAALIRTSEADRFCITARGRVSGLMVRRAEWAWNTYARAYVPDGEPIDGWRAASRAYWMATGEFIDRQRFTARRGLVAAHDLIQLKTDADVGTVAPAA
ncbi:hypothetical protein [Streptomyces lydicus]|uniref:hypothetical protein n=1 Tax=Streptomyces lydicus TaxID=47763 RepID=UPI0036ED0A53